MIPSPELLASGWLPFILNFYWKAVAILWRFRTGVGVSSWFRTPELNRAEGGHPESQHLFALAWDVIAPAQLIGQVAAFARGLGLIAVEESDHVHIQLFPAGALARAGVVFPE